MFVKCFRDLDVWKKAHQLVLSVYQLTKNYPQEEKFGLVSQIRRSAVSVCANLAEGNKKSNKDYLRFIDISQGSLEETKYYLILSKDLFYCDEIKYSELYKLGEDVGRMLNALKRSLSQ